MRNKKSTLLKSIIALVLCVAMLMGTTYAWFTDSVESGLNTIAAGNLDVELYHSNAAVQNEKVDASTELFMDLNGKDILWEPGVVSYENLRVVNEGDLALAYQLALNTANENYIVDPATGAQYGLSQVLQVGVVEGGITATDRDSVVASVATANWTTLANFLRSGSLLPEGAGESEKTWGVVIYWKPGMNDNFWNLNNGKTLNEGDALTIDLGVNLIATQEINELDNFGNEYDANAKAEFFAGFQGGSAGAAVTADDAGLTTAEVAMAGGDVSAVIPAGVQVAAGTNSLALSVALKESSEANIQLSASEEMRPLDVHIEGVAQGNAVPMLITLKHYLTTGINAGALKLYHVENGAPVAMTHVVAPANHNEFSYDPLTGDLTLALASFSEVTVIADTNNPWDGETETPYSGSGTEADPYLIANADQLAYFRTQVDNGNTFEGQYVKLNNNIYLSGKNFDPIGWGYDYDGYTPDGKTFNGTFDGNHNFIFDLKQNGWDLGYSYSMAGGGLFASVVDATIKNLKISGADIRMECIDMGVLVGYSQGNCTYENIDIYNSKVANYQRATGGVVGEVTCRRDDTGKPVREENIHTFKNVNVHSDVVVGSLWGDFDALCGGVVGGRWDDDNTTKVKMEKVTVRCRMDVYNDITSAYQWHAYRRSGMLIGNTDLPAGENRLAQAPFLECNNVDVYYGDWVNYTYCQFTNQDEKWPNNYPWVRVQAGENNSAYSNPRYGHPVVGGKEITDSNHTHKEGDECNAERQFAQLYGGGQGVYGQHTHPGVTVKDYSYSITYMNDGKVLDITYVTDNTRDVTTGSDQAKKIVEEWAEKNIEGEYRFNNGWMNAGSTTVPFVPAGNDKNIVLYPYFDRPYTARFVDQQGNVIAWCFFYEGDIDDLDATKEKAEKKLPDPGNDIKVTHWEVRVDENTTVKYDANLFRDYGHDVTIYPVYQYDGRLKLTPVDEGKDGTTDYYIVEAVSSLDNEVKVPGYVGVVPVKIVDQLTNSYFATNVISITINEGTERLEDNSLSGTGKLEEVFLPSTLNYIGGNTFSKNVLGAAFKTIDIYYNGTMAEFQAIQKDSSWHNGLNTGTRVICTDGVGTLKRTYYVLGSVYNWTWTAN